MHKIRAEQSNIILVDAGDTIQGNFVETFKNEPISPMILSFNALKYDAWVVGNHEFDFGLKALATSLKQLMVLRWRVISSGIQANPTSPLIKSLNAKELKSALSAWIHP